MRSDEFAVVRFANGWRILFDGCWRGRFDDEAGAVQAAMRLAGDVRRAGRFPHLLVQNRFGEMRALVLPPEPVTVLAEASQHAG